MRKKRQDPSPREKPSSKMTNSQQSRFFWNLGFGASLVLGAWSLELWPGSGRGSAALCLSVSSVSSVVNSARHVTSMDRKKKTQIFIPLIPKPIQQFAKNSSPFKSLLSPITLSLKFFPNRCPSTPCRQRIFPSRLPLYMEGSIFFYG